MAPDKAAKEPNCPKVPQSGHKQSAAQFVTLCPSSLSFFLHILHPFLFSSLLPLLFFSHTLWLLSPALNPQSITSLSPPTVLVSIYLRNSSILPIDSVLFSLPESYSFETPSVSLLFVPAPQYSGFLLEVTLRESIPDFYSHQPSGHFDHLNSRLRNTGLTWILLFTGACFVVFLSNSD